MRRMVCRAYPFGMFGDKEITVGIRSNSHYRIFILSQMNKSECLSVCDP